MITFLCVTAFIMILAASGLLHATWGDGRIYLILESGRMVDRIRRLFRRAGGTQHRPTRGSRSHW